VDMARSVTISGGSTGNFSGDGSVAAGGGRKICFMENKNAPFQGHATMPSFGNRRRRLFRTARFGVVFLDLLNPNTPTSRSEKPIISQRAMNRHCQGAAVWH
jgi:hypothetical protein